ncbi:Metallo-dependent phosphatase-like protein [Leucosporidium creatinivorum]|uniref:Sphingomyelin phosphodiesterase n=1 Tax=Leucosporidium creatinivorum TaxID=106004 RepID=A0A1Y2FWS8_9BASI|nr:Metallo-dependent phosphatase-like protein [Leucosporidium creatinivorum]
MGAVEAGISCGTCIGLLLPLKALANVGDDAFVDFFVGFCTKLGIEDADVCAGAVGTQAPILAHDLRSISLASHAAKNFCSTVFGLCPLQQVIPYSVTFTDAHPLGVEQSATKGHKARQGDDKMERKWISKGRKPFQVVHLSDVHPGSNTICSKVICCRDYGLGSTGPDIEKPAGRFGNKHCDAPVDLVESMLTAIEYHAPNKSFTIFTGDVVESAVWAVNEPDVADDLHLWNGEMQTPSYPAFGNHDIAPVNAFPRASSVAATETQWVFDVAARDWEKWIGKEAARQVATNYGCYSRVHPGTGLRIISVNTNYWYKQNCGSPTPLWLYDHDEPLWDPNGILTWLRNELHDTEKAGQRAWIIGHMPFGKVDAMRDQSNYANQIFDRYHNTIAAHFYGHSHVDEFEISYPDYDDRRAETAQGIAYISGALTPASGNPVFRVYDIDPDTYEVMDFIPYYTNKTEPSFDINPIWKPYYSARQSYGSYLDPPIDDLDSLDGKFWHRVTEVFERDESVFQLFNTRLSRGGKVEDCSGHICKNNTICMLRSMRSESNCAVIQPGLSFKDRKRDTEVSCRSSSPTSLGASWRPSSA